MQKFQQFYILKFNSKRLKKAKYKIDLTLEEARKNSELISITNSELLRSIFRYKDVEFSQKKLDELLINKKKLKKSRNTENNLIKLKDITKKIEETLFVESLVSVVFENKAHYREIIKRKGFYINNTRYVPFMASSGMVRRNQALFIDNNIRYQITETLENGRDESVPLVPAKFGAYFALYSSSSLPVSFPGFAVVPDKEIETIRRVDFVEYQGVGVDDSITEKDYSIKANAFDGQGLISPRLAKQWSDELEMDYTFSSAIIRAPFLKGLVVTFDFHQFAKEVANTNFFTDIYRNTIDVRNVDLIVSESMFKLFSSYSDTQSYVEKCTENNLGFSVAKVNSRVERSYSRTSYQFLQVLKLDARDIANLSEPTLNWFRNISGESAESMLLYSIGEGNFEPEKDYEKMDVTSKALMLNPSLSRDRYIQDKFIHSLRKKERETFMGSLLIQANYQFMISDVYFQACHVFKLDKEPLLKDGEHYSQYWLDKGVSKVAAVRSPIVHHSEFNILNFQNREDTRKWYQHIRSGIVYPAFGIGIDAMIHSGSDNDGDIVATINNPTMIKGKIDGLPVVYEPQKAGKEIVKSDDDTKQVEAQLRGHNSKVGFCTNVSSSYYCLLEEFEAGTKEHDVILNRLKIGRKLQNEIIDGVKGLIVPPFRAHWTKYKRITPDMSAEEKELQEFNNRVLCEVRPSFFRFLYKKYMTAYNKELKSYNIYSHLLFRKEFSDIFSSENPTQEESSLIDRYKWNSFFLDNNSVMNRISRYMRANIGLVSKYSTSLSREFDYKLLTIKSVRLDSEKLSLMEGLLKEYKSFKRGLWHDPERSFDNLESFMGYLRTKANETISTSDSELATYAVLCTYQGAVSMVEFPWRMFPEGILQNIESNSSGKIRVPVIDPSGDIEYLWNRYSIKEFSLEDIRNGRS